MNMTKAAIRLYGAMLVAGALLAQAAWAQDGPTRIVCRTLLHRTRASRFTDGGFEGRPLSSVYCGYINNHLVGHGFEVIDPAAHEYTEAEYNRLRERPRSKTPSLAADGADGANSWSTWSIWSGSTWKRMREDRRRLLQGKGAGPGQGLRQRGTQTSELHWSRYLNRARRNCEDAVIKAEKEIAGDEIGRLLTASRKSARTQNSRRLATPTAAW